MKLITHKLAFVSYVAILCFLAGLTAGSFNILKYEASPVEDLTTFQQVKVDPTTGNVFVAGTNKLYKLDEHMNFLDLVKTGPVQESAPCEDPNCIDNLVETDNEAKVLEVDPTSGSLVFCGSTNLGICSVLPMLDLQGFQQLNKSNGLNFIGGKSDVFAFFGNGGSVENSIPTLYSANTYDGRPSYYTQRALAAKRLERKNGKFNFEYLFESGQTGAFTAIDFDPVHKKDYIVKYIYGFEHKGFTYFLTVQRRDIYENSKYTTKLVRVCQNDIGFYSYTELELTCRKKNGITMFYDVAQAGYLAPIGDELASKFGISDSQYALYVAFGSAKDRGMLSDPDPDKGTGICMYAMNSVRKEFTKVQSDCYRGTGSLLPWIISEAPNCVSSVSKPLLRYYI